MPEDRNVVIFQVKLGFIKTSLYRTHLNMMIVGKETTNVKE